MSYCVTLSPNGDITIQPFQRRTEDGNLKFLQTQVGGFIEHLDIDCGMFPLDMWVNEEGLLIGLERNDLASYIVDVTWRLAGNVGIPDIVGNVVITGTDDGDTRGLTLDEVKAISDMAHDFAHEYNYSITVED